MSAKMNSVYTISVAKFTGIGHFNKHWVRHVAPTSQEAPT